MGAAADPSVAGKTQRLAERRCLCSKRHADVRASYV